MQALLRPFGTLHCQVDGPATAATVVFANSLGTDLRLWEPILPLLPKNWRIVRYDKRGHGLSDGGAGEDIHDHVDDAIAVIEHFSDRPVAFVGLSIGGLIAQGVASRRPDLVHTLVLSNTAARLGTSEGWQARIGAVKTSGVAGIADDIMRRWFAPAFLDGSSLPLWRNMMARTPADGYAAACRALSGADYSAETASLRLPTLVIGGEFDGATPPEAVKATADVIRGAAFRLIPGVGHLPPVEAPEAFANLLIQFLQDHLHD
ncbi:MAG: 3-oxoadipate enol-lactonase [Rhodobacteraceae bacterium]|nr:3-oxoadipate enol-lactonase [Paracoccaceae bacterium]